MNEDIPLLGRWIARAFQRYWRVVRGVHLSVEACVVDEAGHTLMVSNESGGSWELPHGPVLEGENLETALRRVLHDAVGIEVNGRAQLAFFYARGKNDQTGVYLVRHWTRLPTATGRELSFFAPGALPPGTPATTAERIRRSTESRTASEV